MGRNRPNENADVGDDVTLTWTAQRAFNPCGEVVYPISSSGTSKVELSVSSLVYATFAFGGKYASNAEGVHSKAVVNENSIGSRIVSFSRIVAMLSFLINT